MSDPITRAAEVIADVERSRRRDLNPGNPIDIARALDEAGLLAPPLPTLAEMAPEANLDISEPKLGEMWVVRCAYAVQDTIGWQDTKGRWWVLEEDNRPTKMSKHHPVAPLRRLVVGA